MRYDLRRVEWRNRPENTRRGFITEQEEGSEAVAAPDTEEERRACIPAQLNLKDFNRKCDLPYGLKVAHVKTAMQEFLDFLGFVNQQLHSKGIARFETMLMPANFSSMVGEFMVSGISKCSRVLVKNNYHNGHPDLIPAGTFPRDSVQYAHDGIEVKASRYLKGWQGHNPEDAWLMVFAFESNRPVDVSKGVSPMPFSFLAAYGARLTKDDWQYTGRSETSRRTITATVKKSGYERMAANWIYKRS